MRHDHFYDNFHSYDHGDNVVVNDIVITSSLY